MPKDNIVSARLLDEELESLDRIRDWLAKEKLDRKWSRSEAIRYLIQKYAALVPRDES